MGIESERIVNNKDFYAMFKSEKGFKVIHKDTTIGEIPLSVQIAVNENIFLAAKIWKIIEIDLKAKKIYVRKANDGKKPEFFGLGGFIHKRVREKMLQIVTSEDIFPNIDSRGAQVIREFQKQFSSFGIHDFQYERPLLSMENKTILYTFTDTKINMTLDFLLFHMMTRQYEYKEMESSFIINITVDKLEPLRESLIAALNNIDTFLNKSLSSANNGFEFGKWVDLLSLEEQIRYMKYNYFDLSGTKKYLITTKFKNVQLESSSIA